MKYKCSPYDDELKAILKENARRLKEFSGSRDQYSGRGMEFHDCRCVIPDYPIREQWLTKEVYDNPLYRQVMETGSIAAFTESFNRLHADDPQVSDLTEEEVVHELMLVRLRRDPSFCFFVCFRIKYKEGGTGPFILNYAQCRLLAEMEEMRMAGRPIRIILLKARQWGGSTLVQLYMAWIQLFVREQWYSVIVAQTKDTAKRIKAMYKKVLDDFPGIVLKVDRLVFSPYEKSSSDSIITDASGKVVRDNVVTTASYENFESTRGMDYAMAHFSEVAYWRTTPGKSAEGVITNIDSNILEEEYTIEVSESTARGMSGYFYDAYQMAKKGKSSRKAVFIPFFFIRHDMKAFATAKERHEFAARLIGGKNDDTVPDKAHECGRYLYELWLKGATLEHINWYILKRESFHDHAQMASEAPSDDVECFKFSGNRVFSIKVVEDLREKYALPPVFKGDIASDGNTVRLTRIDNGQLWIWKHPDRLPMKNRYMVIVDVGGRSEGSDYSVITVIDRIATRFKGGKPEVVARWRGHLRYDYMAYKAVNIARYYDNALLVFESNTFDKKKAESTEFVEQGDHIRGILNRISDQYKNLYMRPSTDPEDIRKGIYTKIGFQTNVKTKQDMVDNFIVMFEDDNFIDHDERFYAEAAIYEQRPDGSYGNIPGRDNHDDILMTDMIGALVHCSLPKPAMRTAGSDDLPLPDGTRNESSI